MLPPSNKQQCCSKNSSPSANRRCSVILSKPALRRSAITCAPKVVHFREQLEDVRYFSEVDSPTAISERTIHSEATPVTLNKGEWQPSWAWKALTSVIPSVSVLSVEQPVRLEQLHLSEDFEHLKGIVKVANLAFQKLVTVRHSFDGWKTVSEISAEYILPENYQRSTGEYDRFQFSVNLADRANLQDEILLLCVRYQVAEHDFWDNNQNKNFRVGFMKMPSISHSLLSVPQREVSESAASTGIGITSKSISFGSPTARPQADKARLQHLNSFEGKIDRGNHTKSDTVQVLRGLSSVAAGTRGDKTAEATIIAAINGLSTIPSCNKKPAFRSAEYDSLIQEYCFCGSPAVPPVR